MKALYHTRNSHDPQETSSTATNLLKPSFSNRLVTYDFQILRRKEKLCLLCNKARSTHCWCLNFSNKKQFFFF